MEAVASLNLQQICAIYFSYSDNLHNHDYLGNVWQPLVESTLPWYISQSQLHFIGSTIIPHYVSTLSSPSKRFGCHVNLLTYFNHVTSYFLNGFIVDRIFHQKTKQNIGIALCKSLTPVQIDILWLKINELELAKLIIYMF